MVSSHPPDISRINVFLVGDDYMFKHYFDDEEIFNFMKEYYNNTQYRFDIPKEKIDEVEAFLSDFGYELDKVEDLEPFVVVVKQYTDHPENIFKGSVAHRGDSDYNYFLMTDQITLAKTVSNGATPLRKTNLDVPF